MKKWILAGLVVLCGLCGLAEVTISNLVVAQRPGTKLMDITYDVASTTTNRVWVSLSVNNGESAVSATSLSGDISFGFSSPIPTGTGKSIVWNAGADWNGNLADLTFALKADETPPPPQGMVQIPAGTNSGTDPDFGAYSLTVSTLYMDATEVTKVQWDDVYNWATHSDRGANGYSFDNAGLGKATNHPVQTVNWWDCVKWCNARSEKEGRTPVYTVSGNVYRTGQSSPTQNTSANGYRLPTVVEWEYAARGGLSGKRFPWGDTIQHTRANYYSSSSYSYDTSSTREYHPSAGTTAPRTMAVKSFAANGYGLYEMAGNVWEWCWDPSGSDRSIRGGSWTDDAILARCGSEYWPLPAHASYNLFGFRTVCRFLGASSTISALVNGVVDSRDYSLVVTSALGTPIPSIGTNIYAWQSPAITCSVASAIIEQGINWRNAGWTGTGDIPASGTTNATGSILLTNLSSSITWDWETSFAITNVVAAQRPGTKLVDITYDIVSDLTNAVPISLQIRNGESKVSSSSSTGALGVNVLPGAGKHIVWDAGNDWSGDVSELTFIVLHMSAFESMPPSGMVQIPAGTNSGTDPDFGAYSLTNATPFYMDATEVTKAQWDEVRTWALTNGYSFDNAGSGKAANHPVQAVNWYDCVKWCNARSEKEGRTPVYTLSGEVYRTGQNTNVICDFSGNGYRLPTVVEWEYAARGGLSGKRFPWGDTITHSNANYYSDAIYSYDISSVRGYHPTYKTTAPYTSPVGAFDQNGYGLYDMAGNVFEWCWGGSGTNRFQRGSSWDSRANNARCGANKSWPLTHAAFSFGFRSVCNMAVDTSGTNLSASVVAFADSRNYTLAVTSAHGTPIPSIGTNIYAWQSPAITCSVASAVIEQGINWRNTGWTGTGSVPATGNMNTTGSILLTDLSSSIAWNWETSFAITNVIAQQRPGTKLVDITYDLLSDVTNAAPISLVVNNGDLVLSSTSLSGDVGGDLAPETDRHIVWDMGVDWDGNVDDLTYSVMHTTQTNFSNSFTAPSDSRNYTLAVTSAHGAPVPNIGTHAYPWQSPAITCSVASAVIEQGINWRNTGWTGTGDIPASGNMNTTGSILLTDLSSSITWSWETSFAITNVVAQQRPGTKLVDITYDIVSDVTNGVPVSLSIEKGGVPVAVENANGDLGEGTLPGSSKSILWDAGLDFFGSAAELIFTVSHQYEPGLAGTDKAWVYAKDYTLTVNDGSGSGAYSYQQQVEIAVEPPADWIGLDYWSGDTNHIDQLSAPVATVTIPAEDITVSAVFKNLYTINPDDKVTITGYSGPGGVVFVPGEIEGRPVTAIANLAYFQNSTITHLTVPASVTHVGIRAFSECTSLEGLYFLGNSPTAGANVLADSPLVTVYYYPGSTGWGGTFGGKPAVLLPYEYVMQDGAVTITVYVGNEATIQIPAIINGLPVTRLDDWSFYGLEFATSVTVPASVTVIGDWAFGDSDALQRVSFRGNAPAYGANPFFGNSTVRIYHPAGGQGWSETFAGRPAGLAGIRIETANSGFGMRPAGFGLPIRGELGMQVVVEISTNLVADGWAAIQTNTITGDELEFIDTDVTNRPSKYYRVREQ